jgi:Asp-tRNA(Asn)/Glu-tRNA(Gln) amidotransferase A subunit family amidase
LEDAQRAQATLCASIADTFGDADLLLSPTIPIPAPRHRQFVDPDPAIWFENAAEVGAFTAAFNLTNGPAASLPAGFDSAGMPVGVQIGGRVGADELLFSVSAQIESAAPWRQHWPKKYAP